MRSRRVRFLATAGFIAVIVTMFFAAGCTSEENEGSEPTTAAPITIPDLVPEQSPDAQRPVSDQVWPAILALHIEVDPVDVASQPADLALVDGSMYLVDTGHGRLVEVSADGQDFRPLDASLDSRLALETPMAIASLEEQLYVANSGAGEVVITDTAGVVSDVISLAKASSSDALSPRPIGIAVWDDGAFAVSDANNNRLTKYSPEGDVLWSVGTGSPASGEEGFNVPGGLALDNDGNVYVVDILNAQVKKYSAEGSFLAAFGESGDTAGRFSRAKALAVDDAGNIYVSDGLGAAIQVFSPAGAYQGLVGRQDPTDENSDSLFEAPHGVKISDGKLYVVDRYAGIFVFDLPDLQSGAGA